jgi:hypothetical protein
MTQGIGFDLQQTLRSVEAAGLFVSLCSISRRPTPPTVDAGGWPSYSSDYAPVTGLQSIPCMKAVESPARPDKYGVTRGAQQFQVQADFHVLLDGYFPAILQRDLAVIDGSTYEIQAVEADSQKVFTRLEVRRVDL